MSYHSCVNLGGTALNWNKDLLEGMEVILSARAPCPECPGDMLVCIYVPLVKAKVGNIRLSIIRQRKKGEERRYRIRTCCIDREDCHGQQGVTGYESVKEAREEFNSNQWEREPLKRS